ncbi:DUF1631 family protein [Hydrogenophaga sp.]|uniref:DUF1631 family protein n=1 Tax=Hydrogenophaga sp. TaxID=1904254 RepID=UPI0025BD14B3|nr:DUF1631 family protein [Hydrogenophaga sp.]
MKTPMMLRLGVANDMSRLRPSLQDCLESVLSVSDSMVEDLLEGLNASINPDHAGQMSRTHGRLDPALVRRLVAQEDALKRTWHEELRRALYHGGEMDAVGRSPVRFDDLRLLDEQQIDATIGFALAEQELTRVSADLLPRLNALVSSLLGWLTVQGDLNPLKPAAFARALRAVLVQHVPDVAQRTALFPPAAGALGESLRQVYRELTQWLLVHGVEPLESPATRLRREHVPRGAVGLTLLTLGRLRQLLAGDLERPALDGGSHEFLHTVPLSMTALEDMDMVEPLIQRLRQRASPSPDSAPPELPIVEEQHLGRLLGQEVVRLMLDNLTQDERLLPAIRQQIGLLEPVLVKLSHADPRFFSERQHPARQLLEAITQRSLGYLSQSDEGFAELRRSVVGAVKAINSAPATEEVFARLLRRLRRRWDEDDTRKNQMRTEAARALLHAEQRHLLAERLAKEFQHRLAEKDVPDFVVDFLCRPWAQAVAESQLCGELSGTDGPPIASVADELIWSAQASLIRRDRSRLVKLVPRLLSQLRQGLQLIDYPADRTAQFFDALVALQEQAFDTPTPVAAPAPPTLMAVVPTLVERVDAAPAPVPQDEAGKGFWMAGQEAMDAGYVSDESGPMPLEPLQSASTDLLPGAWVDLLIEGGWVRAQLTWASPHGTLFMFISTRGLAHSMTRRTLKRLLNNEVLRVISRGDVVEGALDAVAQAALRNVGEPDSLS